MTAPSPEDVAQLLERIELHELADRRADAEYRRGWADGARGEYERGYVQAAYDLKAAEHAHVASLALYLRKWHVCCRACRLGGHRDGCARCEDRTRETFGRPHPDDYTPKGIAA